MKLTDEIFFFRKSYLTDKNDNRSVKYTRDGSFTMNTQGYLVTKDGDYVLNAAGAAAERAGIRNFIPTLIREGFGPIKARLAA